MTLMQELQIELARWIADFGCISSETALVRYIAVMKVLFGVNMM